MSVLFDTVVFGAVVRVSVALTAGFAAPGVLAPAEVLLPDWPGWVEAAAGAAESGTGGGVDDTGCEPGWPEAGLPPLPRLPLAGGVSGTPLFGRSGFAPCVLLLPGFLLSGGFAMLTPVSSPIDGADAKRKLKVKYVVIFPDLVAQSYANLATCQGGCQLQC